MKRIFYLALVSVIFLTNCDSKSKDDTGLLAAFLLLNANSTGNPGGGDTFHCGQTVANPVDFTASGTTTDGSGTYGYIPAASNSDFVTAIGGNNCDTPTLVNNNDGTVTDTANHFLWTLCTGYTPSGSLQLYNYVSGDCDAAATPNSDDNDYTQADAETFCNGLNFAGHSDWILPDSIQLYSLYQNTSPFVQGPFGTKKSLVRGGGGGVFSSTKITGGLDISNTFVDTTRLFFRSSVGMTGIGSLICVAKI